MRYYEPQTSLLQPESTITHNIPINPNNDSMIYIITTYQGGVTTNYCGIWIAFISYHSTDGCKLVPILDNQNISITLGVRTIEVANLNGTFSLYENIMKIG